MALFHHDRPNRHISQDDLGNGLEPAAGQRLTFIGRREFISESQRLGECLNECRSRIYLEGMVDENENQHDNAKSQNEERGLLDLETIFALSGFGFHTCSLLQISLPDNGSIVAGTVVISPKFAALTARACRSSTVPRAGVNPAASTAIRLRRADSSPEHRHVNPPRAISLPGLRAEPILFRYLSSGL